VSAESPLVAETLRLNARYVEEVVIGWGLCPWAAQAWRDGGVARRVLAEPAAAQASEISGVLAFIDEIAARPAISIGLAIFPHATLTEAAWGPLPSVFGAPTRPAARPKKRRRSCWPRFTRETQRPPEPAPPPSTPAPSPSQMRAPWCRSSAERLIPCCSSCAPA